MSTNVHERQKAARRKWYYKNREKAQAAWKLWYEQNKDAVNARKRAKSPRKERTPQSDDIYKQKAKARTRKHKYGITHDEYLRMYAEQNGKCKSCRCPETHVDKNRNVRELCVDHDHDTGVVRGLLCSACNMALGLLEEDGLRIRALADYIEKAA